MSIAVSLSICARKTILRSTIFGASIRLSAGVILTTILTACAVVKVDHVSVPAPFVEDAIVLEFATARTWADDPSPAFLETGNLRLAQARKSGIDQKRDMAILALSGGSSDGAFGAGILGGWTDRGDRPEFEVVSGVSTGAMIAPLAFLGSDYDDQLKDFYTTITTKDVLRKAFLGGLLGGGASLTSSEPLAGIIADVINVEFMEKIAQEHEKGRRLFVITTNIEAERPVVWDMGQIATHRSLRALELFRSVILASASIPGAFPPVPIKVSAGGKKYTELHVDGGTTTNIFLAPVDVTLPSRVSGRRVTIYVIRNGKLSPKYKPLKPVTFQIAGQAISTMIKYQNNADIRRLQELAKRNHFGLQVISMPTEFDVESSEPFDKEYMNALFDFGYVMGLSGELWTRNPEIF
jgi:predicted acylesterase/phospholipase RssA